MNHRELPTSVQASWHGFLETYEPLRLDLYRYCRHLCRSAWDAEDLAQDTLMRAFVTLGEMGHEPPKPRAWLFRVASNLWIDGLRQRKRDAAPAELQAPASTDVDPRLAREAAGTLEPAPEAPSAPAPAVLDAFCEAFNAGQLDHFAGVLPTPPRVELREHRGSWIFLHFYATRTARPRAP